MKEIRRFDGFYCSVRTLLHTTLGIFELEEARVQRNKWSCTNYETKVNKINHDLTVSALFSMSKSSLPVISS